MKKKKEIVLLKIFILSLGLQWVLGYKKLKKGKIGKYRNNTKV